MNKKIKIYSTIYLFIYAIYSYLYILQYSLLNINFIYKIVSASNVAFLVILYIMQKKINIRRIVYSVIILSVFFLSYYKTGQFELIILICFLLCAHFTKIDKIVKISMISTILAVLSVFLCSRLGIVEDLVYRFPNRNIETIHCFGFNYYSGPVYPLFFSSVAYLWLKKNKIRIFELSIFLAFNYCLYRVFSLRLTLICSVIIVIIELLIVRPVRVNISKKGFVFYSTIAYPAVALASILLCYFYNPSNPIMYIINTYTNRLIYGKIGFDKYGISLLGQKIEMNGAYSTRIFSRQYFYIDVGYVYTLLVYGIIAFAVVMLLYTLLYRNSCLANDKLSFMWITIILIFSIVNNVWLTISYNPIILYAAASFSQKKKITYKDTITNSIPYE